MNVFEQLIGEAFIGLGETSSKVMGNQQKLTLWGVSIVLFVICHWIFSLFGLPAIPHISSLLTLDQPIYAIVIVGILFVIAGVIARPIVGNIRSDAPLFCAAIALLSLPTRGGDIRNALFDAGSAGVFIRMAIELALLWCVVAIVNYVSRPNIADAQATASSDSGSDLLTTIGAQTLATLVLLTLIGQSPLKGQAILGAGLAALLATLIVHQSYRVGSSFCYVTGTMLAGVIAYVWSYFSPGFLALGDTSGLFAGAARSLPLHYATAGVAGAIYGYWISGSWIGEKEVTAAEAIAVVAVTTASTL